MCPLWGVDHHISQVNKSVWHEKAQDLSKCKTIKTLFVLNWTKQGCGVSSANEQGYRSCFIISITTTKGIPQTFYT